MSTSEWTKLTGAPPRRPFKLNPEAQDFDPTKKKIEQPKSTTNEAISIESNSIKIKATTDDTENSNVCSTNSDLTNTSSSSLSPIIGKPRNGNQENPQQRSKHNYHKDIERTRDYRNNTSYGMFENYSNKRSDEPRRNYGRDKVNKSNSMSGRHRRSDESRSERDSNRPDRAGRGSRNKESSLPRNIDDNGNWRGKRHGESEKKIKESHKDKSESSDKRVSPICKVETVTSENENIKMPNKDDNEETSSDKISQYSEGILESKKENKSNDNYSQHNKSKTRDDGKGFNTKSVEKHRRGKSPEADGRGAIPKEIRSRTREEHHPDHTSSKEVERKTKNRDPRMEREKGESSKQHLTTRNPKEKYSRWSSQQEQIKEFKKVKEIQGDLFDQPEDVSLAHCVAEDFRMGSGIATLFKQKFKRLPDLLNQRAREGGLATLEEENRFIYYLVTKQESTGKPTLSTLYSSLQHMKQHIQQHQVKKLAIPRIGCGLDRLDWDDVKPMIESVFSDVDIEITVCNIHPQAEGNEDKRSKCKLVTRETRVTEMEGGTLIIYLATTDGLPDTTMRHLSTEIKFSQSFQNHKPKQLGEIIYFDDKAKNRGLIGCFVRQSQSEPIDYSILQKCVININKQNKKFGKDAFEYLAIQSLDEEAYHDKMINEKVITLLINSLRDVEVYFCKGSFEK